MFIHPSTGVVVLWYGSHRWRKPVAAPHLPIGGENEDDWEQVAFERVQSLPQSTDKMLQSTVIK